jgi:hypothetical protein
MRLQCDRGLLIDRTRHAAASQGQAGLLYSPGTPDNANGAVGHGNTLGRFLPLSLQLSIAFYSIL